MISESKQMMKFVRISINTKSERWLKVRYINHKNKLFDNVWYLYREQYMFLLIIDYFILEFPLILI